MKDFDIDVIDVATGADKGADMTVLNPFNGEPLRDEDGNPITISLLGGASQKVQDRLRELQDAEFDRMARGQRDGQAATNDRREVEILVAATTGWSFTHLRGEPYPFTEGNARAFWQNRRNMAVRQQANAWINQHKNFPKG